MSDSIEVDGVVYFRQKIRILVAALETSRARHKMCQDSLASVCAERLITIRNLSATVPYPEEAGNAGVLIAEVGTLRAKIAPLEMKVAVLDRQVKFLRYHEIDDEPIALLTKQLRDTTAGTPYEAIACDAASNIEQLIRQRDEARARFGPIIEHMAKSPIGWYRGRLVMTRSTSEGDAIVWLQELDRLVEVLRG